MTKDIFSAENEVRSNWVKWNKEGEDKIFGTLVDRRTVKSQMLGHEGEDVLIYDLKADYGSFHAVDDKKVLIEEPIVVNEGEIWSIGGKNSIDRQMRNVKLGQKVGLKFTETKPSKTKGFAPAKIIRVFTPKADDGSFLMDAEWVEKRDEEIAF